MLSWTEKVSNLLPVMWKMTQVTSEFDTKVSNEGIKLLNHLHL